MIEDRINHAQLLIEFDKLQEEIRNSKEEWKRLGLASKEQFSVLIVLELLFGIILIIEGTILKKESKCKKQSL
ncbi:hypothetical protein [Aliarcobacter butzleri]|uniref:hypothetical protein n=2 Tax=Aliarcobacter butzleri TaxID=28197 RepID=UPI003AF4EF64